MASQALKPKREEGEPRKLRQVLANSLPFLACAAAFATTGDPWLLVVSAGALAACTADTWASEVGVYSKDDPVNILTRQPMQRGLSGGVSPLGLLATVVGSAATAALGAISEDGSLFGKALIFVVLGESIALYGLLISIQILNKI